MSDQTKDETLSEIAGLQDYAAAKDREIAELERRYGTGIRPAWVGDDIGMAAYMANQARAKAGALQAALQPS